MKVRQAIQIQHILDGRSVPSDMLSDDLVYYSESKKMWIKIVDMDVVHLVRAFQKMYQPNDYDEVVSAEVSAQEIDSLKKLAEKERGTIAKIRALLNSEDKII